MRNSSRFAFGSLLFSGLLGLALLLPAGAARATAITHGTLNFTVTNGSPAPTGSFVWNGSTNTWESFLVNWDGAIYNFGHYDSGNGLSDLATSGTWCGAGPSQFSGQCPPAIFGLSGFNSIIPEEASFTDPNAAANGTYTITEVVTAVPEPGVLGIFGFGLVTLVVLFVFDRRRRLADVE